MNMPKVFFFKPLLLLTFCISVRAQTENKNPQSEKASEEYYQIQKILEAAEISSTNEIAPSENSEDSDSILSTQDKTQIDLSIDVSEDMQLLSSSLKIFLPARTLLLWGLPYKEMGSSFLLDLEKEEIEFYNIQVNEEAQRHLNIVRSAQEQIQRTHNKKDERSFIANLLSMRTAQKVMGAEIMSSGALKSQFAYLNFQIRSKEDHTPITEEQLHLLKDESILRVFTLKYSRDARKFLSYRLDFYRNPEDLKNKRRMNHIVLFNGSLNPKPESE